MTDRGRGRRGFLGACAATAVALLAGCGGGGGDKGGGTPNTVVTGIVLNALAGDDKLGGATVMMGQVKATTPTVDGASATNNVGTFRMENVPVGTATAAITFLNTRQNATTLLPETFIDTQTIAFFPPVTRGSNGPFELIVNIGQVSGRVVLPSGTPANGAFVTVAPSGFTATTDPLGNFLVSNIPNGPIQVSAVIGTASGVVNVTVGNGLLSIGDLKLIEDLNAAVPPGFPATVVGKVTTNNGQSGAGATVILLRDGSQIEETAADATGSFAFFVPVGNYSVRVLKDGYVEGDANGTLADPNAPLRLDVSVAPRV